MQKNTDQNQELKQDMNICTAVESIATDFWLCLFFFFFCLFLLVFFGFAATKT